MNRRKAEVQLCIYRNERTAIQTGTVTQSARCRFQPLLHQCRNVFRRRIVVPHHAARTGYRLGAIGLHLPLANGRKRVRVNTCLNHAMNLVTQTGVQMRRMCERAIDKGNGLGMAVNLFVFAQTVAADRQAFTKHEKRITLG